MSLLRPLRAPEHRITLQRSLQELAAFYGLEVSTAAGVPVTEQTSLRLSTVYACVRLISESLASLPLQVFRRLDRGKEMLPADPRYRLLHDQPNPVMNSFTFRETMAGHALLWGNAYAWIERASGGRVVALWPVRPDKVKVAQDKNTGELQYEYDFRGDRLPGAGSSILHIPGLGFDGITGYSPIGLMKDPIGVALAAEKFGSRFFGNSAQPSGIITLDSSYDDDAKQRFRDAWEGANAGDKQWRVAVVDSGVTWTTVGVKPNEAQFLETRQFQATEIARAFRVPPWMVGIETKQGVYSNVEQQMLAFVTHTLRPWMVRFEQAFRAKLFPEPDIFAEFNADGLLRGDLKSRYEAYQIGHNRWLTTNEIRERENLNPLEGGDELSASAPPIAPSPAPPSDPPAPEPDADDEDSNAA